VKLKETATETFNLLREVYAENTFWRARVFEWHKRFAEGREDDERPVRPLTMKTEEKMENASSFVRTDRR